MNRHTCLVLLSFTILLLAAVGRAATELESVSLSPDIHVSLGTNDFEFEDADVAVDDGSGASLPVALGARIDPLDVSGYALLPDGDRLVCFKTIAPLVSLVFALPGDVARIESGFYEIEFDASANGVPDGAYCDAIATDASGRLLLSFDVDVSLPPNVFAADEDLVRVEGPASFSLFFDGSAAGIPRTFDLDGAELLSNGSLALSFETSGRLGGVDFDDEDVVEYTPGTGLWSLLYDASASDADWGPADADAVAAVPEPEIALLVASGAAGLASLARRPRRLPRSIGIRGS